MKKRSVTGGQIILTALLCLLGVAGCSEGAKLARDTDSGGIVTYLYREDRGGVLGSRYRRAALEIIHKKCPAGYSIVREGEARGAHGSSGSIEGTEDEVTGRRWAMEFRCK